MEIINNESAISRRRDDSLLKPLLAASAEELSATKGMIGALPMVGRSPSSGIDVEHAAR